MNLEGVTISHPRHVLYARVYCVELQRRALYWNWKSNNWPRPHLDVSKENVTYENLAPKTIKVSDCLQHTHAESQARAPSPPKSHENALRSMGTALQSGGPQSHLSAWRDTGNNSHFPLDAEAAKDAGRFHVFGRLPASLMSPFSRAITPINVIVQMCKVDD